MGAGEGRITKATMIGWIVTVGLSIFGSYATINARVYELEKRVELVQLQIDNTKSVQVEQSKAIDEIKVMFGDIKIGISEINGKLNLKADKKFTP